MYARTMAFVVLTFSQLFYSLTMRKTLRKTIFEVDFFGNKYLILSIIVGILLQILLINIAPIANVFKVTKLDIIHWDIVVLLSLIPLTINELYKVLTRKNKEEI